MKMLIKAYEAVVSYQGEEMDVLIGVEEEGHPMESSWDTWADQQIYFYLDQEELDSIKAGEILSDDDVLVSINKDNPITFEVTYNELEYSL